MSASFASQRWPGGEGRHPKVITTLGLSEVELGASWIIIWFGLCAMRRITSVTPPRISSSNCHVAAT